MPSVFISHAAVDKPLIDDFKSMIQEAVGINPTEIFYASSVGSGIPAGMNFVEYMAQRMREAGAVISIITPAYLDSTFCLRQLGAVWYSTGKNFFPLCIEVDYDELQATLTGIQVPRLDQRAALTDLLQRLCTYAEQPHSAAACTEAADRFLSKLKVRVAALTRPAHVPAEALTEAERTRDQLGQQVVELTDQLTEARALVQQAKEAKTAEEIEALEPIGDTRERVETVLREATSAVGRVKKVVAKALPFDLRGEGMPWPEGNYESDDAREAVADGFLKEAAMACSTPMRNGRRLPTRWRRSRPRSRGAMLDIDETDWFTKEFGAPPDLRQAAAFKILI